MPWLVKVLASIVMKICCSNARFVLESSLEPGRSYRPRYKKKVLPIPSQSLGENYAQKNRSRNRLWFF